MRLSNIYNLGIKELRSLGRDPLMLGLIVFAFTISIYTAATALPETLNRAAISIVDEDNSPLSSRIAAAFYPPYFLPPRMITQAEMDARMDAGLDTFAIDIPPNFQRDVLAGRNPAIQLNVDATRMSQAFTGAGYIQAIINREVSAFVERYQSRPTAPVQLVDRMRFNPTLERSWFGAIIEVINNVTMVSVILTGAALIREREHGTIEHLLVMPVRPIEIMLAKILSMGLVVWSACALSLAFVVQGCFRCRSKAPSCYSWRGRRLTCSQPHLWAFFSARRRAPCLSSVCLIILVLLPLEMLSGGMTPRESMPEFVQNIMLAAPTTHFVLLAQAILYRGAGFDVVYPQFIALIAIGAALFAFSLARFRKSLSEIG